MNIKSRVAIGVAKAIELIIAAKSVVNLDEDRQFCKLMTQLLDLTIDHLDAMDSEVQDAVKVAGGGDA